MRPLIRSVGAIAGGFLVTAVASTAADAIMHAAGIFPRSPQNMSALLFVLASGYRALFTVAGGFVLLVWRRIGLCGTPGFLPG